MQIGIKNYLYHKYNEEFKIEHFVGATGAGHPTNQATCYSVNRDRYKDSFNVVRKNSLSVGSRLFASDNYFGIIIKDDYIEYIDSLLKDDFEDYTFDVKLNYSGTSNMLYMSDVFDNNTSLKEFLKYQNNYAFSCNTASIEINLKSEDFKLKEKEITEFISKLKKDSKCIIINIYYGDYNMEKPLYEHILINSDGELFVNKHNYMEE